MTGWRRLGIVLGAIYWMLAIAFAVIVYFAMRSAGEAGEVLPPVGWSAICLVISSVFYAMLAGIWWALAGFRKA